MEQNSIVVNWQFGHHVVLSVMEDTTIPRVQKLISLIHQDWRYNLLVLNIELKYSVSIKLVLSIELKYNINIMKHAFFYYYRIY